MLEDYAYWITNQSESLLSVVGIGIAFVGFFVALRIHRRDVWTLQRVPYLIMFATTTAISSAMPMLWLSQIEAMRNGVLWVLFAVVFLSAGVIGYFLGVLARARSASAYGYGGMAWLAVVPLANLILFFKRPVETTKIGRGGVALNVLGVAFGLVLLLAGKGILVSSDAALEKMQQKLENDPALIAMSIEGLLRAGGLDKTLRLIASAVQLGRIDEAVVLSKVEVNGNTLRYIYDVSIDLDVLPKPFRNDITRGDCENRAVTPVFKAGGAFEYVYLREDGTEIGRVSVTRSVCAF